MRLLLSLLLALALGDAAAQGYPARPLHVVVGFTPGGGVDINARLLSAQLQRLLGQPVIVDNKPGAGTNIANEYVAKSAPDGYTLLFTSTAVAINMPLYRNPPYDLLRDFVGVSLFSETTNILVVPASLPAGSVKELIALARSQPGTLNFSSPGVGSTSYLAGELFKLRTGTNIVHVPYKGNAPSITALIAGQVQLSFINPVAIGQHVKTGRLRALAVAGSRRAALLPDVPTMKEAGVDGVEVPLWYGLLAPAATPREALAALSAAAVRAAQDPEIRKRLSDQGAEAVGDTSEEFTRLLHEEVRKWTEVIRVSGVQID